MSASVQGNVFEVGGEKYMAGKMTAFQQFHVLRKLGPVIAKIGPTFMMVPPTVTENAEGGATVAPSTTLLDSIQTMGPVLEALSEMSESDCDYVLQRCLSVTKRWQDAAKSWVSVWNERAARLQFEDIDLSSMMKIAIFVLGDSLAGFSKDGALNIVAPSNPQNGQLNTSPFPTVRTS